MKTKDQIIKMLDKLDSDLVKEKSNPKFTSQIILQKEERIKALEWVLSN